MNLMPMNPCWQKSRNDVINILIPRVKAKFLNGCSSFLATIFFTMLTQQGKFVIGGPHGDTGLPAVKLLLILMEVVVLMAVVHFQAKTLQKLTARQPMLHVILLKTW
jgi:hypothetical protein